MTEEQLRAKGYDGLEILYRTPRAADDLSPPRGAGVNKFQQRLQELHERRDRVRTRLVNIRSQITRGEEALRRIRLRLYTLHREVEDCWVEIQKLDEQIKEFEQVHE